MAEVDSHFHVWELDRFDYPWPNSDVAAIFKTISYPHLTKALNSSGVKNAVFVQCLNNNIEEAIWVLKSGHPAIKGVVAGVNLTDHKLLSEQLDELCKFEKFVGVRHILDMEDSYDWVMGQDVIEGLKLVAARGKTFDFLSRPHHLHHVATLAKALPELHIVIDHIAKPHLSKSLQVCPDWRKNIEDAASCSNVFCKISGLVTEVDPVGHAKSWSPQTFADHVKVVLAAFGPDRCMIGSDWPVLRLTGTNYKVVNNLHKTLVSELSEDDQVKVCGGNAAKFYQLKNLD